MSENARSRCSIDACYKHIADIIVRLSSCDQSLKFIEPVLNDDDLRAPLPRLDKEESPIRRDIVADANNDIALLIRQFQLTSEAS